MIYIAKVESEGGGCPYQVEAITDDGRRIYVRYRFGTLKIEISPVGSSALEYAKSGEWQEIFRLQTGDKEAGFMTYAEMKRHTAGAIQWPEIAG
jgi:hypothetical protein